MSLLQPLHPVAPDRGSRPAEPVSSRLSRVAMRERVRRFGRAPRLLGLDTARGLAVFGMIGAHVGMTPSDVVWGDPATWGALVHGRSSILFALVAGISVSLLTGGRSRPEGERLRRARLRLAGRALAVMAIGLGLEMLGTSIAVILPMYGFLFLVLLPFLGWTRRRLTVVAGVAALVGPALSFFLEALSPLPGMNASTLVWGTYPLATWLPLLLSGMVLGRSDLSSRRLAAGMVLVGAALSVAGYVGAWALAPASADGSSPSSSYSAGGGPSSFEYVPGAEVDLSGSVCVDDGSGFVSCFPEDEGAAMSGSEGSDGFGEGTGYLDSFRSSGGFGHLLDMVLAAAPHSGGTLEILGAGGLAAVVVGTCLLVADRLRWLLVPVAAVGTMPLTAYALHVVSVALLVAPLSLAGSWLSLAGFAESNPFWLVCVLVLMALCTLWTLCLGQGPLERLTAGVGRRMDQPRAASGTEVTR